MYKIYFIKFWLFIIFLAGCDVFNQKPQDFKPDQTPPSSRVLSGIYESIEKGDLEQVKSLLAKDEAILNFNNPEFSTPFNYALQSGRKDIVLYLLHNFSTLDLNYSVNTSNHTPLTYAIDFDETDTALAILNHKNGKSLVRKQNTQGFSPLILAISHMNVAVLNQLLSNYQPFELANNPEPTPINETLSPYTFALKINSPQVTALFEQIIPSFYRERNYKSGTREPTEEEKQAGTEKQERDRKASEQEKAQAKKEEDADKARKEFEQRENEEKKKATEEAKRKQAESELAEQAKREKIEKERLAAEESRLKAQAEREAQESHRAEQEQKKRDAEEKAERERLEKERVAQEELQRQQQVAATAAKKAEEERKQREAEAKSEQERLEKELVAQEEFLRKQHVAEVLNKLDLKHKDGGKPFALGYGEIEITNISKTKVPEVIAIPTKHPFVRNDVLDDLPDEIIKPNLYIWDHKVNHVASDGGFEVYEVDKSAHRSSIKTPTENITHKVIRNLGGGGEGAVSLYSIAGKNFAGKRAIETSGEKAILEEASNLERLQFTNAVPKFYGFAKINGKNTILMEVANGSLLDVIDKTIAIKDDVLEKAAEEMPRFFNQAASIGIFYDDIKPANFLVTDHGIKAADLTISHLTTKRYRGTNNQKLVTSLLETKLKQYFYPIIEGVASSFTYNKYLYPSIYRKYSKNFSQKTIEKVETLCDLNSYLSNEERAEVIRDDFGNEHDFNLLVREDGRNTLNTGLPIPLLLPAASIDWDQYRDKGIIKKILDKKSYGNLKSIVKSDLKTYCYYRPRKDEFEKIEEKYKEILKLLKKGQQAGEQQNNLIDEIAKYDDEKLKTFISDLYLPFILARLHGAIFTERAGGALSVKRHDEIVKGVYREAIMGAFKDNHKLRDRLIFLYDNE